MDVQIKNMNREDLEQVIKVQRESFSEDLAESLSVFENRFNFFGEYFLSVFLDKELVGYAICFPWKLGEIPSNNKEFDEIIPYPNSFYIHDICFGSKAKGLGLSRKVLDEIYNKSKKLGFNTLSLVSVGQAGSFWDKMGYQNLEVSDQIKSKLIKDYGSAARVMVKEITF